MVFKRTRWAALLGLVLGLAACGGGDTAEPYVPTRIIAFGDELSLIESDGRKYSINALNATTQQIDCVAHPLWIQAVAHGLGMSFPQCPNGTQPTTAELRAAVGDTVADLTLRLDAYLADTTSPPKHEDLVLMMVGMNDVWEVYQQGGTEADMRTELEARGRQLAQQVNRLALRVGGNPAVIISTIPDIGKTPQALALGSAESALLSRLVAAFNLAMRVNMVQDGRLAGIVFADSEITESVGTSNPHNYLNVISAACNVALPDCNTTTLVPGATGLNFLWADDLRPGPTFHQALGAQALTRAVNNPF